MQEELYPNGDLVRRMFSAETDGELIERMKKLQQEAEDAGAVVIRQAVLEPEQPCPCGSGKKTKNCCLRRYRSIMANAGFPVPPLD